MSTTTMHFGPEWMRAKQPHAAIRPHAVPSPPPATTGQNATSGASPAPLGAASYSALLTPPVPPVQAERDTAHPFKYSRDEILQVWKDGGGRGPLPIEVEMWEGVVRERAGEPACLRELTEAEKKIFATGLNSELRRRQSTDFVAQGDRGKLHHANSSLSGALRDGLGIMGRRRRGDSTGADQPALSLPRKTSWSNAASLVSPSLPSPRTRVGNGSTGGNFDGVLNGSDSPWNSGKSRGLTSQSFSGRMKEGDPMKEPSDLEIKEEEETSESSADNNRQRPSEPETTQSVESASIQQDVGGLNGAVEKLSINTNNGDSQTNAPPLAPPGSNGVHWDEGQFKLLQWSYVDPSGIVQGPFTGEAMQSWHDQHYFTDDLMMKRTAIDVEFMPLAEIKRRAQGERVFLCPLVDVLPPPGLLRQAAPPGLNTFIQRNAVDVPSQPSPQAYGRSSTLDSYLAGVQSASPVSSFGGGGLNRTSISPDPLAVGGRLANARFAADLPLSGRVSAGSYSSTGSPAVPQAIRSVFSDGLQPTRQSSFDSPQYSSNVLANVPWQTPHMNGAGWNGIPESGPQVDPFGIPIVTNTPGNGHSPFLREPQYNGPLGPPAGGVYPVSSEHARGLYEHHSPADILLRVQQREESGFAQAGTPSRFAGAPQQLSMSPLSTGATRDYDHAISHAVASPNRITNQQRNPLSPWGVTEHQRPRPFEADHPTTSNTFVATPAPAQPVWPRPAAEPPVQTSHVPWLADQQLKSDQAWAQVTDEPQDIHASSVSSQEPKENALAEEKPRVSKPESTAPVLSAPAPAPTSAPSTQTSQTPASTKKETSETAPAPTPSKKKANVPAVQSVATESPHTTPVRPVLATSPSQKSAWATDEEKAKQAAPMGLREIQEAEKKRQDARKAKVSEVERDRAARAAAAASPAEDVQFTASWGLPTSRAGARTDNTATTKDTTASPSPSTTPVWTNANKPAAKTMKEILEEEERRKLQAAKEKESVASAAKRLAQGGPPKTVVASVPLTGSAWTTVGVGGKTNATVAVVASRASPTTQTSSTNTSLPSAARPSPTAARQATAPPISKTPSSNAKTEEAGPPSPEFLKWMRDSLKGLNSTVQFEEIAQMLLSFPLDPDKATVELISETVYGASTTLDGRRFASEFITKRKADAASRRGAPGLSDANGRPASLADVVKAQPKPAQNEFGGYKVVKKKNKGGRS